MFAFALFLALANAAANYTNSTVTSLSRTSSNLTTITSSASLSSASCAPGPGLGAHIGCDQGLIDYQPKNPITRSCTGADSKGNWMNCNRTGLPIYTFDYEAFLPPYGYTPDSINTAIPTSLVDVCWSQWNTSIENWWRTAPITPASIVPATTITAPQIVRGSTWSFIETVEAIVTLSTTIKGVATVTATTALTTSLDSGPFTWSAYTQYNYASSFSFTAEKPCCFNCTLYGGNVQVYYWPTAAPAGIANSTAPPFRAANSTTAPPAVSTIVNSAGFTFVSPSIYVAFESLRAKDLCGPVGPTFSATTLAFDPTALSTSTGYHWDTAAYSTNQPMFYIESMTFTQATFGDKECTDITESFYQGYHEGTTTYADYTQFTEVEWEISHYGSTPDWLHHYTVTYNPCSPTLSVPKEVYTLFPSWKTCGLGISAFFDPPSVLTHGTGDSAFTTVPPAPPVNPVSTIQASAAQSPAPVMASVTTSKVDPAPTPTATKGNDPSVQPPSVINSPPAQSPATNNPPPQSSPVVNNSPPQSLPGVNNPSAQAPPAKDPPIQSFAANSPPASSPAPNNPQTQAQASNNPPASSPAANNPPLQAPAPSNPAQTAPAPSEAASSPGAITIGSSIIAAGPSSNFIVASQTLTPGGQIIHSGTQYSLASNAGTLIVGGSSTQIIATPAPVASPPAVITVGGSAITADSSSAFIIASQTLTPGGHISHSGVAYSLASNGDSLVVGGTATQAIVPAGPKPTSPAVITIGGSAITADSSSAFIIDSQTLTPGGQISQSGIVYSLASNGGALIVGGTATQAILPSQPTSPPVITVGSSTITANSASAFVVGAQTLTPGSQITNSGTILSLASNGGALVVGSSITQIIAVLSPPTTAAASYLVGSQTLSAGGAAVTVSGTTYSLPSSGSSVVVNGATQPLSALLSSPNYVVGSQTLVAGAPAITVSGTAVSLQPGGSSVVVGGKTEPLSVLLGSSTTTGQGLGGIIATLGGFGGPSSSAKTSSSVQVGGSGPSNGTFTGGASVPRAGSSVWVAGVGLGLVFVGML